MPGEDVLSLIQSMAPGNAALTQKLGGAQKDTEAAAQEQLAAQQKINELSGVIEKQKNNAELQTQIQTQVFEKMAGGNVSDPNSLMAKLVQDRAAQETERMAQAKKIEQMDSVGFLDNPIAYIQNAFTINGEIDKHNFHAQQAEADSTAIQAIQASTQEANATALKTANVLTQATQAAKTEMAAKQLEAATAALKVKLAGENINAINALMNGQQHEVQMAYTGMRVQMDQLANARADRAEARADNAAKLEEEKFLMHMQEANMRIDLMKEQFALKKEDADMQKLHAEVIAKGAATMRLNPEDFTVQSVKMMERTQEGKAMIEKLTKAGLIANTSVAGAIGATPGEALFNIHEVGSEKAFQDKPEAGTYNKLLAAKEAAREKLGVQVGNEAAQARALITATDEEVLNRVKVSMSNAEAKDSFYQAPKLAALIENVPEIKDKLFYATILQPMLDSGVTDINASVIKAQIQEAVKRGVIPQGQAMIEGAKVFSSIATFNNVHGKLAEFGIPTQKGYVVSSNPSMSFIGAKPIHFDLAKPSEFQKWFMSEQVAELTRGHEMNIVKKYGLFGFDTYGVKK